MDWLKVPYRELSLYIVSNVVSNGFDLTVSDDWKIITWARQYQGVCLEYDSCSLQWRYFWIDKDIKSETLNIPRNKLVFTIQGIIDHLRFVR